MFYHWHYMESEEIQRIILIFSLIFIILILSISIIFSTFNNRKNKLLTQSIKDKSNFKNEISKAKLETKDNTLNEMSKELHDNIGQILSVAKMQVSILKSRINTIEANDLTDLENLIGKSIDEIRLLTRLLRIENFNEINLHEAIDIELERINRLKHIHCTFENSSIFNEFLQEHEVIIFRIFQEAISNILKHSQTLKIEVKTSSNENDFILEIRDYGIGIASESNILGSGLTNMKNRARLLNSDLIFKNEDIGTAIILKYPIKKWKIED